MHLELVPCLFAPDSGSAEQADAAAVAEDAAGTSSGAGAETVVVGCEQALYSNHSGFLKNYIRTRSTIFVSYIVLILTSHASI